VAEGREAQRGAKGGNVQGNNQTELGQREELSNSGGVDLMLLRSIGMRKKEKRQGSCRLW